MRSTFISTLMFLNILEVRMETKHLKTLRFSLLLDVMEFKNINACYVFHDLGTRMLKYWWKRVFFNMFDFMRAKHMSTRQVFSWTFAELMSTHYVFNVIYQCQLKWIPSLLHFMISKNISMHYVAQYLGSSYGENIV